MAVATRSRELQSKYAFEVFDTSDGLLTSKFQKASGYAMDINIAEYSEGGAIAPMKESTRVSFSDFTLERGISLTSGFYRWCLLCANMLAYTPEGAGVASPSQLKNLFIKHYRRNRTKFMTINFMNCQPKKFVPSEADNTSIDINIESLEVAYEFFTRDPY